MTVDTAFHFTLFGSRLHFSLVRFIIARSFEVLNWLFVDPSGANITPSVCLAMLGSVLVKV